MMMRLGDSKLFLSLFYCSVHMSFFLNLAEAFVGGSERGGRGGRGGRRNQSGVTSGSHDGDSHENPWKRNRRIFGGDFGSRCCCCCCCCCCWPWWKLFCA